MLIHHILRHILVGITNILSHVLVHPILVRNLLRSHHFILRSILRRLGLRSELQLSIAWVLKLSKISLCLLNLFLATSNPFFNATGRPTGPELFSLELSESSFKTEDITLSHLPLTTTASTPPQTIRNAANSSNTYDRDNNKTSDQKGWYLSRPSLA